MAAIGAVQLRGSLATRRARARCRAGGTASAVMTSTQRPLEQFGHTVQL
jgi:hypothetical protein